MIDEFNVREVLGVASILSNGYGNAASVRLTEGHDRIALNSYSPSSSNPPELTPDQARCLARQLYRLARRIDARASA